MPTFYLTSYANIPVYASTCATTQPDAFISASDDVTDLISVCIHTNPAYLTIALNFFICVTTVLTFIGWFLIVFFFPTGLWALAFDNIGAFCSKPETMRQEDFSLKKRGLAHHIGKLIEEGK